MAERQPDKIRSIVAFVFVILIGLVIGIAIKRVHLGLLIGLAIGMFGGIFFKRK